MVKSYTFFLALNSLELKYSILVIFLGVNKSNGCVASEPTANGIAENYAQPVKVCRFSI